jgi:drug/metabolite transporter (DMT)-like permease
MDRETKLGYIAVVAVVILWGLGPLFVRAISAPPSTIAMFRNWLAVPITLVIACVVGAPLTWSRLWIAVPSGLLFALSQNLGFASFQETSLANAVIIGSISPLLIVIVAVPMFGEHLTAAQIALMVTAFAGVALVVLGANGTGGASMDGDLLAVGSLIAQTGYLLSMKKRRMAGFPVGAFIAGVFLVAAIAATPVALAWGDGGAVAGEDWLWIVLLTVLTGCAGHGLMTWAQKHVDVGLASVMVLGSLVVTAGGAWVFFDQELRAVQIVGGLVTLAALAGVLGVQFAGPRRPAELPDLAEPPIAE